jgi:hypothetical protein
MWYHVPTAHKDYTKIFWSEPPMEFGRLDACTSSLLGNALCSCWFTMLCNSFLTTVTIHSQHSEINQQAKNYHCSMCCILGLTEQLITKEFLRPVILKEPPSTEQKKHEHAPVLSLVSDWYIHQIIFIKYSKYYTVLQSSTEFLWFIFRQLQ